MASDEVGEVNPAAARTADRIRHRGNGDGTIYYVPGRRRPWAASVVVGWSPEGRAIRRTRFADTPDQAEYNRAQMVSGEMPERRKPEWRPVHRRRTAKRRSISKRLRFLVLQRDDFACVYCGGRPPKVELHLDHRVPFSKGGLTTFENLVTACADCNLGKHDLELPT